jgi:catechol 2,3-dioxygenase-like lactoylglutathione lyase family enzyme
MAAGPNEEQRSVTVERLVNQDHAKKETPMTATTQLRTSDISHVAIVTPDLDRFVSFYNDVLGARLYRIVDDGGPILGRNALVHVGGAMLHVFERPDVDRQQLAGGGMFNRGRLDHIGLHTEDEPTFLALRDRLVQAGASDGEVHRYGPVFSVHFRDPDGMEAELNWVPPEVIAEAIGGQ